MSPLEWYSVIPIFLFMFVHNIAIANYHKLLLNHSNTCEISNCILTYREINRSLQFSKHLPKENSLIFYVR